MFIFAGDCSPTHLHHVTDITLNARIKSKSFSFIILTSHYRNTDVGMNYTEVTDGIKNMSNSLTQALPTLNRPTYV